MLYYILLYYIYIYIIHTYTSTSICLQAIQDSQNLEIDPWMNRKMVDTNRGPNADRVCLMLYRGFLE